MDNGTVSYKCPSCGAGLTYSAESRDFHCIYCGSHFSADMLDAPLHEDSQPAYGSQTDNDPAIEEKRRKFGDESRLYICPSCGASIFTDSEVAATAECYYCHSPAVLSGRLSGEFRPDLIIPFKRSRGEAIMKFNEWIKPKKFFLAKGFGSSESLNKIQGIYIPFWLTDCCVEGKMTADCYKTVGTARKGDYIVVTEDHSFAVRDGSVIYRQVPADASSRADDALMDSIEPFDYKELTEFDMSYLSGHSAQRYDMEKYTIIPRITNRVTEATEEVFKSSIIGYNRINVTSKEFRITNINFKQAMMPMWFLTYFYKDKLYYFAMNGQTGKFGGRLPLNKPKLIFFSFGIPMLVGTALFLLLRLGGML